MKTYNYEMQSAQENEIVLHEHEEIISFGEEIFAHFIKNKRKLENNSKGKPGLSTKELAGRVGVPPEMFRKIINKQKPNQSRDCIIAICAALQLDVEDTNEALRIYQFMPKLDEDSPRDKLIIQVLNSDFDIEISVSAMNDRLQRYGFQSLDIVKSRARKGKETCLVYQKAFPYEVKKKNVRTSVNDMFYGDPYESLSTAYDFHRYRCIATMWLDDTQNKKQYKLTAEPDGNYFLEILPWPDAPETPFRSFKSIDETDVFRDCFLELQSMAKSEQRHMEEYLNDTRNYYERINADILHDSIHVYFEKYNYTIPERNEYYLMEYIDGIYRLSVSHNSQFMSKYLTSGEYREHYGNAESMLIKTYDSIEEIEALYYSPDLPQESKEVLMLRKIAYKKMQLVIDKYLEQLRARTVFVRNLERIWDDQDRVCAYYGLEKEFQCKLDDECGDFMTAELESADIIDSDGQKVTVTLSDLRRAFELGYKDTAEICCVLRKKGSIEAVLQ
ncbi:hypothetical protein A8990_10451 [Paenibacillus taihuensis]|uniref:Helix-turn-helix protein n=1 Tax=Paenibacillus taihuensis TaxID=1156355 RepID=A0A3D9SCB6_9BACL|nr:helix-turn-helix transcriptional regulator [Paenibacillus taihuensis]REE91544.1 hypothetical protein A8990_10451 [Paenibacillus taihuensis]